MVNEDYIKDCLKGFPFLYGKLYEQECEFMIWPSDEIDKLNEDYDVAEYLPGYYAIGSDGGLEMLTVELATGELYVIPFVPMDITHREKVADTLQDLINNK